MRKKLINIIIAFIGLMLSPITWWNDPFVNIPLSYFLANFISCLSHKLFPISFILFYWLTNILGIFLLYFGGGGIIKGKFNGKKQLITVIIYTFLILILSIFGLIKPTSLE